MRPTDEYDPVVSTLDVPVRDLTIRVASSSAHALMMLEYYSARDAWLFAREAEAMGYATEEALFAAENPRPLLRDFMKNREGGS